MIHLKVLQSMSKKKEEAQHCGWLLSKRKVKWTTLQLKHDRVSLVD